MAERTYIAIDLKSFYASSECAELGFDPFPPPPPPASGSGRPIAHRQNHLSCRVAIAQSVWIAW